MVETAAEQETKRMRRLIVRADTKRVIAVKKIRSIHDLAIRSKDDVGLVGELRVAVPLLDDLWAQFEAADNDSLDGLIEIGAESEYSAELPAEVLSLIRVTTAIASRIKPSDDASHSQGVSGTHEHFKDTSFRPASRLPEIPLPSFKGDFQYWPTFRDRFSALVGDRADIPKIDKMQHLIGCLHGSASDAIRNIPVSADNYELAWSTLSSRFHRPRLVANALIEKLINAPVSSQETLSDLNNFVSNFSESISLLNALKIDDLGSFIMFSMAFRCLPASTRKLFESSDHSDFPPVTDLLTFVESRVTILEIAGDHQKKPNNRLAAPPQGHSVVKRNTFKQNPTSLIISKPSNSKIESCSHCHGKHTITVCRKFASMSVLDRNTWARENGVCYTCLSANHWANKCTSRLRCDTCSGKHHTLLHGFSSRHKSESGPSSSDASLCAAAMPASAEKSLTVLLGTALVHIRDYSGTWQTVRALIDSASQISAITVACSTRLGLRPKHWTAPISGLSGTAVADVRGTVECTVQPRFAQEPQLKTTAWVLPSITSNMPRHSLATSVKDQFANLALADPTFDVASPVDVLLGADLFSQILDGRKVTVTDNLPTAFSSIFGWILIGPVLQTDVERHTALPVSLTVSIENLLERFWRVEEPAMPPLSFTEDGRCEEAFVSEYKRLPSGRFAVPLPTRTATSSLTFPGSREHAIKRFENLEKRLSSDFKLRELYSNFMAEYLALDHMSVAKTPGTYFIPHHAVYRPADGDGKIRVVFDASARGSRGPSLNECLLQGPKLQQDIVDVLTRFRVPKLVFTADICKMYRQILVLPEYRTLQHVFWRSSPLEKLIEYELNTVTYGMNCAPFLALRVLKSIALGDCGDSDAVRDALLNQTYVDDVCAGADSITEVLKLQSDIISILGRAGLVLKKWSSNEPDVLNAVPADHRVNLPQLFNTKDDNGIKVLGLQWHPTDDFFSCALRLDFPVVYTKRGLLSMIARIFDPLGLFAPATFYGKCIMQRTWAAKSKWDEPLPADISRDWASFVSDLPSLSDLKVPRHFNSHRGAPCFLLGFCDASQHGYAAVLYVKMLNCVSDSNIFLVGSKTKLAPIKSLSIPRLELNAALLLSRWMNRIRTTLQSQLNIVGLYAWSDSAIVLSWLNNPHSAFKIYVSNRAHQISTLVPDCRWLHVRSEENPADCASRGVLPSALSSLSLYWQGPQFIHDDSTTWDETVPSIPIPDLPETRPVSLALSVEQPSEWYDKFSSYDRLVRVVAYIFRFFNACKIRSYAADESLQRIELDYSVRALVIASQRCFFTTLSKELSTGKRVSSKHLARLRPFLDPSGVIRVGGRLRHSNLNYDCKHPMLLAKQSHLSTLLCRRWHKITCHAGPRIMTALISREFWIVSIKSVLHSITRECPVCVRFDAKPPQPIMADLPAVRVQQSRPFARVGVDFAGPLQMRELRLRKSRSYKVYIAVFVCFSVKAVHLEVVTELSTEAFLAAFDRFVARRGLPSDIFSDCGTNFIGADKQLQLLINSPDGQRTISQSRSTCQWHFNPPSAPHFGGLWEAAVRSTKRLLIRTMGTHSFTYEEFTTLLTRVEAVLNSRPLSPLTTDPADLEYLSPGHFLIGQPLLAVPPRISFDARVSLIQRWKLLDQCHQAFWRRWTTEYLTTLQGRSKWSTDVPNVNVNDMVVIIDNQAPPLTWRLGRITELLPGNDGVVRVVRLLTRQGQITRPVAKIVVLPTQ